MYGFTFVWLIDVINVSATDDMKTMIDEFEQAKDDARLAKDDAAKAQGKLWISVIENVIQTA